VALFSNRDATGQQLALVHGLPWLPAVGAILLTLGLGVGEIVALGSGCRWGWWCVVAYQLYLLFVPASVLGPGSVSGFANVFWPVVMLAYMVSVRSFYGVGASVQQWHRADSR
jgi:hypothetical protein